MDSELNLSFLDDLTLAGPKDVVAADVHRVTELGGKLESQ